MAHRVKHAREGLGLSQSALARSIGVSPQAIQKLESAVITKPRFIVELAHALNVSPEYLSGDANQQLRPLQHASGYLSVCGIVQAGAWRDVEDTGDIDGYEHVPASPAHSAANQIAFAVNGTSLNKVANDGDILVCLDFRKTAVTLKDGDLIVVERSRYNGQQIERTAKRLRKTLRGFELWPESTDPSHQQAIELSSDLEHEEISVIAKVLWILKKP